MESLVLGGAGNCGCVHPVRVGRGALRERCCSHFVPGGTRGVVTRPVQHVQDTDVLWGSVLI